MLQFGISKIQFLNLTLMNAPVKFNQPFEVHEKIKTL